jgi:hypothetical protein
VLKVLDGCSGVLFGPIPRLKAIKRSSASVRGVAWPATGVSVGVELLVSVRPMVPETFAVVVTDTVAKGIAAAVTVAAELAVAMKDGVPPGPAGTAVLALLPAGTVWVGVIGAAALGDDGTFVFVASGTGIPVGPVVAAAVVLAAVPGVAAMGPWTGGTMVAVTARLDTGITVAGALPEITRVAVMDWVDFSVGVVEAAATRAGPPSPGLVKMGLTPSGPNRRRPRKTITMARGIRTNSSLLTRRAASSRRKKYDAYLASR